MMIYVNWDEQMILNAEGFVKMGKTLKAEINASLTNNPEYSFETWINSNYTAHDIISSSEAWQMGLAHEYANWFSKQVQLLLDATLENDWEKVCV